MKFVDFAKTVGKLKQLKRSGWVRAGVKDPESVAEHVFRVSVLAMAVGSSLEANTEKLIKMSLVHDLAESLVGDIVVDRGGKTVGSPEDKHQKEAKAIRKICRNLPKGDELVSLWEEFEHQKTPGAKILKELDRFEMALQALEYERDVNSRKLDEFWESARKYIKHPLVKGWFTQIEKQRSKIKK